MSEHGWLDELLAREESRHPVPPRLRQEVVAAVTTGDRFERRTSRVLVLAAAALVIVAVAGLVVVGRLAHPLFGAPVHRPGPVASPTPGERDYGPVPAGVAVAYAIDPRQPSWLIAYDASGRPVGTVKLPQPVQFNEGVPYAGGASIVATADGSRIITGQTVFDSNEAPASTAPVAPKGGVIADDGVHVCAVDLNQTSFAETLMTGFGGAPLHAVREINREPNIGQTGDSVSVCSYRNDFAVVLHTQVMATTDAWFVRLSTGAVLNHLTFPANTVTSFVFSPSGRYFAEGAKIVRASDGSVVADLGSRSVYRFLSDSEVIATEGVAIPSPKQVSLIDWTIGRTLWSYQGPEWVAAMQPVGGSAWLLYLATPVAGTVSAPYGHLLVIDAQGKQTSVTGVNLYPVPAI